MQAAVDALASAFDAAAPTPARAWDEAILMTLQNASGRTLPVTWLPLCHLHRAVLGTLAAEADIAVMVLDTSCDDDVQGWLREPPANEARVVVDRPEHGALDLLSPRKKAALGVV